jgi:energy-coupling factor transporter ATP-binding protein EcfA2
MALLKLLGLSDLADKLPAALSGGQQQIAAIARALSNDPPIIVADEPTGNLDSATEQLILEIFEDLARRGKTILIVTHDPVLARRSTRRVLISDGELVNELVAQALPALPHNQLLKIGKIATRRIFEPGATLARQGILSEGLYIVSKGAVQVFSEGRLRAPRLVGQIGPGQYFSELEQLETENCNLIFRASPESTVEALCVSLEKFNLLVEDPATEHALRQAAVERSIHYCPRPASRPFLWWGRQ